MTEHRSIQGTKVQMESEILIDMGLHLALIVTMTNQGNQKTARSILGHPRANQAGKVDIAVTTAQDITMKMIG